MLGSRQDIRWRVGSSDSLEYEPSFYKPTMVYERIDNLSMMLDPFLTCKIQWVTFVCICIIEITNGMFKTA
jgi:hypothetical protein